MTEKLPLNFTRQNCQRAAKTASRRRVPALQISGLGYIPPMRQLFAAAIVATMLIVGAGLGFILAHILKSASSVHEENTATVVQQVQTLSDLVTVKYVVEKVVILDDVKWYGESRVLLLAHGIVKAGIELKRLQPGDVRISGKAIRIRLPLAQVTDAYLDDRQTQVIDHTTGLMREFDKDLEQTARQTAVGDIERAARREGILNDAKEKAQLQLALFLHQAGYENIEFVDQAWGTPVPPAGEGVPKF